ncbi:MAG: ubiquinol-cytochrome c reductase iron-sulfur subunit, partial [Betaproteobacteria bacterium]|nr:ubiquinol-cytochrome c reductase iron-sulfur subunit [Betaproteobacteria bacterium]
MNDNEKVDPKVNRARRNLVVATSVVGGAAGVGAAVPFAASMWPSERARAAGAPVEVDLSRVAPGELNVIEWRGKPVWVLKRTKEMLESLKKVEPRLSDPDSKASDQPKYAENEYRSRNPDLLVLVGVCTHLGCSPQEKPAEAKAEMGAD